MVTNKSNRPGAFPYVIAGLAFIPVLGIPFGLIAIVWGLITRKTGGRKLMLIGGAGIACTAALYLALYYFSFEQRGGIHDELRQQLAETALSSLVQAIEFYNVQHGYYPDSLETLQQSLPAGSLTFIFDPTDVTPTGQPRNFHYEVLDRNSYYLLGVGPDGVPFTADDLLPPVEIKAGSSIGLTIR